MYEVTITKNDETLTIRYNDKLEALLDPFKPLPDPQPAEETEDQPSQLDS